METISGENNLIVTFRREGGGVTITHLATADAAVTVPETLCGLPVIALGDHALTPERPAPEGEQVRISCGAGWAETPMDNKNLAEVALPRTLQTVGDYAFYNCTELTRLRLFDTTENWGGSVLMNCHAFHTIALQKEKPRSRTLHYFADELSCELDVTLTAPDGTAGRFLFPEYQESYEENSPAHHFDYQIFGAGYPYHHCFRDREFFPADYDALWDKFLRTEHDALCALRLAWYRLHSRPLPEPSAAQRYLAYLTANAPDVLHWLIENRDGEGLAWFLKTAQIEQSALRGACGEAREKQEPGLQVLLLEALHRRFPSGAEQTFDL
ncbi:MAG: leucine-rich repeat domain-containing protein [Oscillibacter sp.]|nr:leucine-rich repeat domain-containing protein [Oscillibacter sp.]